MAAMEQKSRIYLITGGARSGKSVLAERLVKHLGGPAIYIATAEAFDGEMRQRIEQHRQRREAGWRTIEEPRDLVGALDRSDGQGVRLVDCLTLWLANLEGQADVAALGRCLLAQTSPVVLVTNELGLGIVPENRLARAFRDEHGVMNQTIAEIADEVWMAVSGLPLRLKPQEHLF